MRTSIELPPLRDHFKQESSLPPFSPRRELLPSIMMHSPPGRSSTLPPIQPRKDRLPRPRKSSINQNARKPKQDRPRSKEFARRPSLGERKALSAEPQTAAWAQGKRWEDLIEAATSATEADDDQSSEVSLHLSFCCLLSYILTGLGWTATLDSAADRQYHLCAHGRQTSLVASPRFQLASLPAAPVYGFPATQVAHPAALRAAPPGSRQ